MGTLRIISRSSEPFRDRTEAGGLLARELKAYEGSRTVVLGIPRGGVVVAARMAQDLSAELDIVLTRKVGAPGNPELAIGAVTEEGHLFLNDDLASRLVTDTAYVEKEKARQMAVIRERLALYRRARPKAPLQGRTVIITDDGLATGATMQAAIWAARREKPKNLIVAVPVGPEDTALRLARDADELVCLRAPAYFAAVGQFYRIFDQVEDAEVLAILGRKTDGGGS